MVIVRLADGDIEQEGRPEVCVDGIWGYYLFTILGVAMLMDISSVKHLGYDGRK